MDDRQGRPAARAAGLGDPRRHRQDALAALPRAHGALRRPGVRPRRRRRHARAEGDAVEGCRRRPSPPPSLAGEPIVDKATRAPGNDAAVGGLKVTTESAWFAARPSGTEDVYKIYAESFRGPEHLAQVQAAAREVVDAALGA
nr:hypothetical protein [Angustibacter aerolatus]